MKEPGVSRFSGAETLIVTRHARGREREERLLWRTGRLPHHDPYTVRSLRFLFLLVVLWCVNLMDALSTLHGVAGTGWDAEANVLLRIFATEGGVVLFLAYKVGVVTVVALSFWLFHRALSRAAWRARSTRAVRHLSGWRSAVEIATVALVLLFASAVVNNLRFAGVL